MTEIVHHVNIAYRRSRRARNLRITIDPARAITVTVPVRVPLKEAEAFVLSRQGWIQKHLDRMSQRQRALDTQPELSPAELKTAQNELLGRLEQFSERYDLPYNRVAFRCQKTKWGSCSSGDNISLNINLAFLPTHLQDYILVHELCHIRHKNHGKNFWTFLDQYCDGNAKQLAKELRGYGMRIRPLS